MKRCGFYRLLLYSKGNLWLWQRHRFTEQIDTMNINFNVIAMDSYLYRPKEQILQNFSCLDVPSYQPTKAWPQKDTKVTFL